MITAIVYLLCSVIVGLFSYKCYSVSYGKHIDNPFGAYAFWFSLFIALSFFKSTLFIVVADLTSASGILFWSDFIGRAMFYFSSIFVLELCLYKFFPEEKRRSVISSLLVSILGIPLLGYQFFNRNAPFITDTGIVNWNSDLILGGGMFIMIIIPWIFISYIFIREFIKSKFRQVKSFLLGSGFILLCFGSVFQDMWNSVSIYILFSIIEAMGLILILAGMYYEEE